MSWTETTPQGGHEEWEREDGLATLRVRERPDGSWVLRADRLEQAPEGSAYRRERFPDRAAVEDALAAWKAEFDTDDGEDADGEGED